MRKRNALTLAAGAAAALVAGGVAMAASDAGGPGAGSPATLSGASDRIGSLVDDRRATDDPADEPTGGATASPTSTMPAGPGTAISRAVAERIALGEVGGRVTETELEWEHGRRVWKVELASGASEIEVEVDATSGAVVEVDRDDRDGGGRDDGHDDGHDDD